MKVNNETIKNWGQEIASVFTDVENHGAKNILADKVYEIDCSQLDGKFIYQDIRDSDIFKPLFDELQKIEKNPCIYFFEIVSDISAQTIIDSISKLEGRTKPSIKKRYSQESKILYVGKVKKLVWGRLIMHFGLHTHKNKQEQSMAHGLQLRHWAKPLNLKLRLHIYEFEPEMADYIEILERKFAKSLQPIIGRH